MSMIRALSLVGAFLACMALGPTSAAAQTEASAWTDPDRLFTLIVPEGWQAYDLPQSSAPDEVTVAIWVSSPHADAAAFCEITRKVEVSTSISQAEVNEHVSEFSFATWFDDAASVRQRHFSNTRRSGVQVAQLDYDWNGGDSRMLSALFGVATARGPALFEFNCEITNPERAPELLASAVAFFESLTFPQERTWTSPTGDFTVHFPPHWRYSFGNRLPADALIWKDDGNLSALSACGIESSQHLARGRTARDSESWIDARAMVEAYSGGRGDVQAYSNDIVSGVYVTSAEYLVRDGLAQGRYFIRAFVLVHEDERRGFAMRCAIQNGASSEVLASVHEFLQSIAFNQAGSQ
jgi:hypothetical protein